MGGSTQELRAGPPVVPGKSRTAFLDIARGLAAVLVVYTHVYDVFIRTHKDVRTLPTDVVDNAFVIPLKLDDQGLGAIAVPIFFVISGFVVTPLALRMGGRRFGINRVFRIYPLLVFVVAFSAVLIALGRSVLSTTPPEVTVWTFLSQASLWNYIDRPFGAWVAVSWTLAVEVLFYAATIALLPLLRRRMWLAIAVQLWVVLMLLITYRAFGDEYRALVINMVYVLVPVMGQAIWAAWSGRIPAWLAGVFVTVAWLMFVWAGHLGIDPEYIPRPFPIAFALMLFLIGLFAEPYLRQRTFWTGLSDRTYSIYLVHGSVAFPLMHWLFDRLPLWLTVLIAVVATGLAAELSFRFVERPSHQVARRLSRRRAPEPSPTGSADDEPTEKLAPVPGPRRPRPAPVPSGRHSAEPNGRPFATPVRPGGRRRAPEPSWPTEQDDPDNVPSRHRRS
jgi:peptidoglycan/LPS O-acetylase OafA/YrhL